MVQVIMHSIYFKSLCSQSSDKGKLLSQVYIQQFT